MSCFALRGVKIIELMRGPFPCSQDAISSHLDRNKSRNNFNKRHSRSFHVAPIHIPMQRIIYLLNLQCLGAYQIIAIFLYLVQLLADDEACMMKRVTIVEILTTFYQTTRSLVLRIVKINIYCFSGK